MAARYSVIWTGVTTGTALKTICQLITGSTDRLYLIEMAMMFDGTATATPVTVDIRRGTAAGSGGVSATPASWDASQPTSSITANTGPTAATWTTEPTGTAGTIMAQWKVSPTSGLLMQWPLGREPMIPVSTDFGICVTAGAAVNATGYIVWEE